MIDFNKAINLVKQNGGFTPNGREDSFYRTYVIQGNRPMQVRISNHGTHLWTWLDKSYDPSYAINTCIVYSEDGSHDSNVNVDMNLKDKQNNIIGKRKPFEVIQYVYNCQLLDENDSAIINQAVQSIWKNRGYKDPLTGTPKHAKVYKLIPNQSIETLVENNNNNKMKRTIHLKESELKQMIRESIRKTLTELDWKTYANAGNKVIDDYDDEYRADDFFDMASKRFKEKYGTEHDFSNMLDGRTRLSDHDFDSGAYQDAADWEHERLKKRGWANESTLRSHIQSCIHEELKRFYKK